MKDGTVSAERLLDGFLLRETVTQPATLCRKRGKWLSRQSKEENIEMPAIAASLFSDFGGQDGQA